MKKFLTAILALALTAAAAAQNLPDVAGILGRLESNRVTSAYRIVVGTDAPVIYEGTATAQGNCFRISGNGLEIYCDGSTLTVADPAAMEAYVEDASSLEEYIKSNIGGVTEFKLSGTSYGPKSDDKAPFVFEGGPDWIVTDLR